MRPDRLHSRRHVVGDAGRDRTARERLGAVGRRHHERGLGSPGPDQFEQIEAGGVRQVRRGDHAVERLPIEHRQRLVGIRCGDDVEAVVSVVEGIRGGGIDREDPDRICRWLHTLSIVVGWYE